ncbi:MAG: SpoIIE family protein phosphatase [Candidatus Kapabacteria bacterium]|nr:SpoIIE family protein phosphatase [Candidatus Kapabacteria bacterium]
MKHLVCILFLLFSFMNLYSDDYTRFNDSTKTLEIIKYDENFDWFDWNIVKIIKNNHNKNYEKTLQSHIEYYEKIQYSLIDSNLKLELTDTLSKLKFYNFNAFKSSYLIIDSTNNQRLKFDFNINNKILISKFSLTNKTNQTLNLVLLLNHFQSEFNPCFYIYTSNKLIQKVNLTRNNTKSSFSFNGINIPLLIIPNQEIEIYYIENIIEDFFDLSYFPKIQSNNKYLLDRNIFVFKSTILIFPFFVLIIFIYWYYSYYLFSLTFIFLCITQIYLLVFNYSISNFISSNFQIHIVGLLLYSSVLLFLNEYLNIKYYYRKWSIIIKSVSYFSIFSFLLSIFKLPIILKILISINPNFDSYIYELQRITVAIVLACFMFLNISIYIISIKIFKKGIKNALYIIIGWSFVISFYIFAIIGILDEFIFNRIVLQFLNNHISDNTLQFYVYFGIFFEMFVFLFAIAKKTRQGQIDLAKEETERLLQEQEKKLILEAHKQLTAKNEEILSSMRYAGHLQSVVLPLEEKIQNTLPNNFIIFKPKDIVSGDFYWYADTGNFTFIGLGDCTGHGIPGSMLTMIGTMLLDQAVIQNNIYEIDQIIRFVNIQFIKSVNESKKTRDGMELAIIKIHKNSNKIEYSGLGINLYIISDEKLNEFKAKRASIGEDLDEIDVVEVELNKNDKIYLFSDGYADQNNSGGKKYGKTRLKELIINSSNKSIKEQKNIIESELEKHKGTELQRDDVTIIGIEI